MPVHIILTPFKNIPVGLVCGASGNFQIGKTNSRPSDKIKFKRNESFIELGLNYMFKTKLCDFIPEVKYCFALTNEAGDNRTEYANAIKDIYRISGK